MTDAVVDTNTEVKEEVKPEVNGFFDMENWKSAPTVIPEAAIKDPVIDEKDKIIEETKPEIVKPNDIKEEVKPVEVKTEAVAPEPLKFANEESEKIFNLLKEGKNEEVFKVLAEQQKLVTVEGADAIKLQLQYQNKDFSDDDINELFNERYEMPEKPVQDLETDEEFAAKIEKYERDVKKVENRIARDAKPAKTELQKLQKEIVFTDIKPETSLQQKEPTQEELAAIALQKENFLKDVDAGAKTFNGYNATFKDKEVEIPVAYVVTEEEKNSIKPLLESAWTNLGDFFTKVGWADAEGTVNTAKMIEDLHLIQNKESIFSRLVSETGNRRYDAAIKSFKNIDYSGGGKGNGDMGVTHEQAQKGMTEAFFV